MIETIEVRLLDVVYSTSRFEVRLVEDIDTGETFKIVLRGEKNTGAPSLELATLTGQWELHSEYGEQFIVSKVETDDEEG